MTYIAMVVGAFYVYAGFVVLRWMALEDVMDRVLSAVGNPPDANDRIRAQLLTWGGFLTLLSGVALVLLSPFAMPLFLANVAVQGGYLWWAERALKPESTVEVRGRQQTKSAFVTYLAATAFVAWLASQSLLRPWKAPVMSHVIELAALIAGVAATWVFIHAPRRQKKNRAESVASDEQTPAEEALPLRLRLAPEWNCSPLWNADTGEPVSVYRLGLSFELADRIEAWDDTWQATYNDADPASGGFKNAAAHKTYVTEGRAIVEALRSEWRGEVDVDEALW